MNYIEQINVFWKLDAEHSFSGNETRLYFYLLNLSNSLYWKNPLTNADSYTATVAGIAVNTLKTVRNRLQQAGLISFKPGGSGPRDKCQYWIIPAAQVLRNNAGKGSTIDTLSKDSLTPYLIPGMGKIDDISKHKPDQTRPNGYAAHPPGKILVKKAGKKKNVEEEPFWEHMISVWFDFNVQLFLKKNQGADPKAGEPSWEEVHKRALRRIVKRLRMRSIYQRIEWQVDVAIEKLRAFLTAAAADRWLYDNFILSNLEKQFDKIILNNTQNGNQHRQARENHSHRAVITGTAESAGAL